KDAGWNEERRGHELSLAEHLARLDDEVRSRADAAADHVVEVHVRVEDNSLKVRVEFVIQARGIREYLLPFRQRHRRKVECRRKVRVVELERGGERAAV